MTTAAKGVQKALARAGASVIAIAEMTAEDLLAQMTDDQKTALVASVAPKANAEMPPKKDDGDGDEMDPNCKDKAKEEEGTGDASASANNPALVADPRVKAVSKAVETDDACKGKADLALAMLADDDYAGLSASGIVKLLGKTSVSAAGDAVDTEAAARAEMKAALSETKNSEVDPNGGGSKDQKSSKAAIWDQAIAANNPGLKLA